MMMMMIITTILLLLILNLILILIILDLNRFDHMIITIIIDLTPGRTHSSHCPGPIGRKGLESVPPREGTPTAAGGPPATSSQRP
jgi:hypothetical protein